jgi:hypothetical protein
MQLGGDEIIPDQPTKGVAVMKPLTSKPIQIVLIMLALGLASLACSLLRAPAQPGSAAPASAPQNAAKATPPALQKATSSDNSPDNILQPDPLDHLLALHSIQISLTVTRPDGSSSSTEIATDSSGNMDLKFNESAVEMTDMPKGFDPKALKSDSELLVVGGKAYLRNDQDPTWMNTPVEDNFPQAFAEELHGMDGPALWLNMLPDGSIQPAGKDNVGGFAVDKYVVNGKVDNQVISGTLWEEPQSDALIQAELHVPGALMSDPDQPLPGELKIVLKAQKADVPPVTLPPAPPPTAVPTTAP